MQARYSLSFSRGHQTHGVVAGCVRQQQPATRAGQLESWLLPLESGGVGSIGSSAASAG
jgi:hypothetical protein